MPALTGLSLAKFEKSDLLVFLNAAGRWDGDPYRNNRITAVGDGVSPSRK
jgi:hypothetical protein